MPIQRKCMTPENTFQSLHFNIESRKKKLQFVQFFIFVPVLRRTNMFNKLQ